MTQDPNKEFDYTSPSSYSKINSPLPNCSGDKNKYNQPDDDNGYKNIDANPTNSIPLREAIRQLPQQYRKILTWRSAAIFAEEANKARWDIVWIQLLGYAFIATLVNLVILSGNFNPVLPSSITAASRSVDLSQFFRIYIISTSIGHI